MRWKDGDVILLGLETKKLYRSQELGRGKYSGKSATVFLADKKYKRL